LQQWLAVFRTIQSYEVWKVHGSWIQAHSPQFGPGIRERFDAASEVTSQAAEEAREEQQRSGSSLGVTFYFHASFMR
jgi:amidase